MGAAVFISLISLVVYVLNDLSPQLWILGVRNYFLYMPLAFIVARTFERDDIERFARLVAVLAVPIAFICVQQSFSPKGGWLNVGAGGAPPPSFADGLLRTTGVLASDAQHVMYIAFSLSLLVAVLVGGRIIKETTLRIVCRYCCHVRNDGRLRLAWHMVSGGRGRSRDRVLVLPIASQN